MTTTETNRWTRTPEEIAAEAGISIDELRARSVVAYLMGPDERRTRRSFHALWTRWANGKINVPLCVEMATEMPIFQEIPTELLGVLVEDRS